MSPLSINLSTLLFQIFNFLVMVAVLTWAFFKPVIKILDDRAKQVTQTLDLAEKREQKARAMGAEYEQKLLAADQAAAQIRQQAQDDVERIRQRFLSQVGQEIQEMRQRAQFEIGQAGRQAVLKHRQEVGHLVVTLSERLIDQMGHDAFRRAVMAEFVARLRSSEQLTDPVSQAGIAELISAGELDDDILVQIQAVLQERFRRPISLKTQVDPSLVAGATLRLGDLWIDGSLDGQLRAMLERYLHEVE